MAAILSPFRRIYAPMVRIAIEQRRERAKSFAKQRLAHEQPIIFYSLILGAAGPIAVLTVPPIRKSFGWKPAERPPTTYPLPNRKRNPDLKGYDDE